ncbi:lipoprotein insertase outer membrane protein LolB [Oceanobacter mangrovi]|uniref:lipoprotein insertase outer membrane protein LolB n=1 Tax=Oceanobacter mangrovi TaxID=2862510 RepID=UPI001C8F1141|nr:lipoprotein insertase outer membrane protein LolB [Oceanobacter mangrovi]
MIRALAIAALALFASACALLPGADQPQQLQQLSSWQVQGKLSVRNSSDSVTGYMTWKQDGDRYNLFVSGPLGQGSSRLSGDRQHASLTLPDQDTPMQAANAEQLLYEQLGWSIPVAGLPYWIKGMAAPDSQAAEQRDNYGLLAELQQDGWTISYKRYQQYQGVWLPGLIKLTGYDYKLTLAINDWTLYD